jgi:TonB family protein
MRELVTLTATLRGATLMLAAAVAATRLARPIGAQVPAASAALAGRATDASGVIAGVVRDAGGAGLPGAEVQVDGTPLRAETDEHGAFRIAGVRTGSASLVVRRIGYRAAAVVVQVASGAVARPLVTMRPTAQQLAPMIVRGQRRQYTGRLADFYRRRDQGIGHFITRDEVEHEKPHQLTDMLRTVPGVRIDRNANGSPGGVVLLRGANCPPLIWMDGLPLSAAYFDPDNVDPQSVEAVEIYNGVASIPAQFHGAGMLASCGVIAIWTRIDDPVRRRKHARAPDAAPPAGAELPLYTANDVDTPARPDPAHPVQAAYPNALLADQITGMADVEFVVDTLGRVEPGTVLVVSTSDVRFGEAARQALPEARFTPATLRGRPVRQVTHLPFVFRIDEGTDAAKQ